jgi:stage II sporulation protein P
MLRKKLSKIIMSVLLACSLLFSVVKADSGFSVKPFELKESSITYSQKLQQITVNKGKILIYHSHGNEKYKDATIFDVGADLTNKLEKKGFLVEHIIDDFSKDYNKSYYQSRKMLLDRNLNEYSLILDIHCDAGENATTTIVNNNKVARCMFVSTKENPNRDNEIKIAKSIMNNLNEFGKGIHKDIFEKYFKGITYYNADLNKNMLLVEVGNQHNTKVECQRTNTYLASAIDKYIQININNINH